MRATFARFRALRRVRRASSSQLWSNVRCGTREPYLFGPLKGDLFLARKGVVPHTVRLTMIRGAMPEFGALIAWIHEYCYGYYCVQTSLDDDNLVLHYAFTDAQSAFQFKMRWA